MRTDAPPGSIPELAIDDATHERLTRLMAVKTLDFRAMTLAAGLDPATSFRGQVLRGIDFGESDLSGFDFTGADLANCDFRRADISLARFDDSYLEGAQGLPAPSRLPEEFDVSIRLSDSKSGQELFVEYTLHLIPIIDRRYLGMPEKEGLLAWVHTTLDQITRDTCFGLTLDRVEQRFETIRGTIHSRFKDAATIISCEVKHFAVYLSSASPDWSAPIDEIARYAFHFKDIPTSHSAQTISLDVHLALRIKHGERQRLETLMGEWKIFEYWFQYILRGTLESMTKAFSLREICFDAPRFIELTETAIHNFISEYLDAHADFVTVTVPQDYAPIMFAKSLINKPTSFSVEATPLRDLAQVFLRGEFVATAILDTGLDTILNGDFSLEEIRQAIERMLRAHLSTIDNISVLRCDTAAETHGLTQAIERLINSELGERFGLVFSVSGLKRDASMTDKLRSILMRGMMLKNSREEID